MHRVVLGVAAAAVLASGCGSTTTKAETPASPPSTSQSKSPSGPSSETASALAGVDLDDPDGFSMLLSENLKPIKVMRVQYSTNDPTSAIPRDVTLSAHGVHSRQEFKGFPVEAIVINSKDGYLKAPPEFWLNEHVAPARAAKIGDAWIRSDKVAQNSQQSGYTFEFLKDTFVTNFAQPMQPGDEAALSEITYKGQSAIKLAAKSGYVIAVGDPLLPIVINSAQPGAESTFTVDYDQKVVTKPKAGFDLDR